MPVTYRPPASTFASLNAKTTMNLGKRDSILFRQNDTSTIASDKLPFSSRTEMSLTKPSNKKKNSYSNDDNEDYAVTYKETEGLFYGGKKRHRVTRRRRTIIRRNKTNRGTKSNKKNKRNTHKRL